ncbi:hypothetical protein KLP28_01660 [Nocardioidaceae bacterium]|nr:hypothetical protein KLP28_01660 [Nocardioidaceae bacterium]
MLATGLVATGGSAASAEEFSGNDARRDLASGSNLYAVDVTHDPFDITVSTKHRRIPNTLNGTISVYLDTDRTRRGPEYVMNGALGTAGYGASMLPTQDRRPWRAVKIDSLDDRVWSPRRTSASRVAGTRAGRRCRGERSATPNRSAWPCA